MWVHSEFLDFLRFKILVFSLTFNVKDSDLTLSSKHVPGGNNETVKSTNQQHPSFEIRCSYKLHIVLLFYNLQLLTRRNVSMALMCWSFLLCLGILSWCMFEKLQWASSTSLQHSLFRLWYSSCNLSDLFWQWAVHSFFICATVLDGFYLPAFNRIFLLCKSKLFCWNEVYIWVCNDDVALYWGIFSI